MEKALNMRVEDINRKRSDSQQWVASENIETTRKL
jgi:hypothetical protein